MAEKLVDRLRRYKYPILDEAADEIERLERLQSEPPHCATCHCEPLPNQMLQRDSGAAG